MRDLDRARNAVRKRVSGFATQGARRRDAERWARRRSPDDAVVLVPVERHMPYLFAPPFYQEWLDWLGERDPQLRAQIEVTYLPADLPPDIGLLHAWVQDPVRERNARLFGQLVGLQQAARAGGAAVVQPVEVLSNSARDVQFERLTRAGLRTPRTVRVGPRFAEDLGGLSLPVVVRASWGHGHMARLDTEADVARWLARASARGGSGARVASEYIEAGDPDGLFRKYRYVMFGERGTCRHMIVSKNWEVRPADRVFTDETIAEEIAYVSGPCPYHDAFDAARRELEFDIAAFDYSLDTDGVPVVWEVNPYPDLSRPKGRPGEYLDSAIERGHQALTALYRDRLATAAR